ncbi:MAG TPA: hypothetical protein VM425_11375 [Myxococcota bacterium]|nr:hypothetical protein [Myxococcota bacterium]
MPENTESAPRSVYPGLLLLSAASLLLEVALARILSVSLWYHFAFMVVSTALFGLGLSGVVLALRRRADRIPDKLLAWAAVCVPPAFVIGYVLYNLVPCEPFSLGVDPLQWIYLPLCYLAVTLPFFASGLTVAALLTRYARGVHRLYLFDLSGAALGSLALAFVMPALGGSGSVFAAAALAASGAALIAWRHGRRLALFACGSGVVLLALTPFANRIVPVRISSNKVFAKVISDPKKNLYTAWNTISRVDVVKYGAPGREQRSILIDAGTALTRMAHPIAPLTDLLPGDGDEDFFYRLFDGPRVLVVGSGGGREVLMALKDGASAVWAVEINPAINRLVAEIMADFTGHIYADTRVTAVTDEARSYIRRSAEHYQVIHCPHTISNAALAAGSLSLAENHLLTIEAFDDYLDHLSENGVLVITRPEAHLPRLFTTVRAVFEDRGLGGLAHSVLAWRKPARSLSFYAGFAVRRRPFSPQEVSDFAALLTRRGLQPLFLPRAVETAPYYELLTASDPQSVAVPFAAILDPATDDRPFFNQRQRFSQVSLSDLAAVFNRGRGGRMALENRPVAEAVLLVLLAQSLVMAVLFIVLPLWVFRRRALAGCGRLRTLAAFCALGLGYIVVEVGLIQRLTLYLGRPVVVFSTVLGTLLFMSGLGSAYSRRFASPAAPWRAAALAAIVVLLTAYLSPLIVGATLAWPAVARVLMSIVILTPVGFVMGMPFPLLVKRLQLSYPERIPWAWGVNGFAAVVGSVGAVVLGMTIGFTGVLVVGVLCYLTASLASLTRRDPGTN